MNTKAFLSYLITTLCWIFFAIPALVFGQSAALQRGLHQLRHELPQIMDSADVPGLSIAIWENDFFWQQGFGVKNVENQQSVKTHTLFEAASLSKPVFAYLVMKLVEKGRLDLDKPLLNYLPREEWERRFFQGPVPDRHVALITARMVLTHSSGFPNWRGPNQALYLKFPPGSAYSYSGEGYMMLQLAVEQIMHRSLNKLARAYVFDPLGMENSSFRWEEDFEAEMAYGHNGKGQVFAFRKPKLEGAAFSLITTVEDYSKFLQALLRREGMEAASFEAMFKSYVPTGYGQEDLFGWGMGLGIQELAQGKALWHWGDNNIYKCFFLIIPEKNKGFVYFTNSSNGLDIGKKIAGYILQEEILNFQYLGYDSYDSPERLLAKIMYEKGIVEGVRFYEDLKVKYEPNKPPLDEQALIRMGYHLLGQQKGEEAIELFKINAELYPNSWNAYDSLGEAYMRQGNDRLAIVNYERSLRLNPENTNGINMLKKLRK